MDFFSKLGDSIVSATQEVGEKAKGMTDVAKLQYEMRSKEDFLNAMIMSAEFVLKKKGHIDHLQNTVEGIIKYFSLNKKEEEKLNKLLNMCKGGS